MRRRSVIALSGVGLLLAGAAASCWYTGPDGPNAARDRIESVLPKLGLEQLHATKLCDYSYGGHGLLNSEPRYNIYFEVDRTDDLDDRVQAAMRAAGFDPWRLANPPQVGDPWGYFPDGIDNPSLTQTGFRALQDPGRQFDGMVTRDGMDPSPCHSGSDYTTPLTAPRGRAVVMLFLLLNGEDR